MIEVKTKSGSVKVVLDSISPEGIRLPTLQLRNPRMIHADFLTHRVFTRNGRSSRAVPVKTLITEAPYVPHFLKNKPGMVAIEEFDPETLKRIQDRWEEHARATQDFVAWLASMEVHKQWANRPLEWFGYIDVLLTSTDIANFMALRHEEGAQPEIQHIAEGIEEALRISKPKLLKPGEWHMPYITNEDFDTVDSYFRTKHGKAAEYWEITDLLKKISVARCARLTIKPFDGDASIERELDRYNKLMVSRPVHASPAEHIATPDSIDQFSSAWHAWENPEEHGNFYGWRQFRKTIPFNTVYDR